MSEETRHPEALDKVHGEAGAHGEAGERGGSSAHGQGTTAFVEIPQESLELLQLDRFDTAFAVSPERDAATKRRFMTLFVESAHARNYGSMGYVARAQNALGETFAVKRLRPRDTRTPLPGEQEPRLTSGQVAAFREEYKSQLQLSHMKGFPRLYGLGEAAGEPVIVMEWIEGSTLDSVRGQLPAGTYPGSVDARTVAALGYGLFSILEGLDRLAERPVHRDISPSNIMLRTADVPLPEQVEREEFDLRLIDFGSATVAEAPDARFTMLTDIWRNGTPEYAPPEMLTHDAPNVERLRQSPSIDVYAVCSVLYELLAGVTPFRIAEQGGASPYRVKMDWEPGALDASFGVLGEAVMAGLRSEQGQRATASELRAACGAFLGREEAPSLKAFAPSEQIPAAYEGAHLSMPPTAREGGGSSRAPEKAQAASAPATSRRSFVVGAAVLAGAAVLGAAGAFTGGFGLLGGSDGQAGSETSTASTVAYTGGTLYLAQDAQSMRWGYLNSAREWVVAPQFEEVPGFFSEGLAYAKDNSSGLFGFLDYQGQWAIEPVFARVRDFTADGLALAVSGSAALADGYRENRVGWIDTAGAWVIPPTYEGGGSFGQGRAPFKDPDAADATYPWGYLNKDGSVALAGAFYDAKPFSDAGLAPVAAHAHSWGFIDSEGNLAIPARYAAAASMREGFAAVMDPASELWGFIDAQGNEALPFSFADARNFLDGRVAVKDRARGLWGFVDAEGAWLLEPKFLRLGEFAHGLAPAQDAKTELFGYIDDQGEWVIAPQYPSVGLPALE